MDLLSSAVHSVKLKIHCWSKYILTLPVRPTWIFRNVKTPAADAFLLSGHVKNNRGAFIFMHSCMHSFENMETRDSVKHCGKFISNAKKKLLNLSNFSKFLFTFHFFYLTIMRKIDGWVWTDTLLNVGRKIPTVTKPVQFKFILRCLS